MALDPEEIVTMMLLAVLLIAWNWSSGTDTLPGFCFPDGRPSRYFYFEDLPSRRLKPLEQLTSEEVLEQAQGVCQRSAEWNG